MPQQNRPLINGHMYQFSSLEISLPVIGLINLGGVKSINYKASLAPGKARGTSADYIGRTRGVAEYTGDIEIYKNDAEDLCEKLVVYGRSLFPTFAGDIGYLEVPFGLTISAAEPNSSVRSVNLSGVRLIEDDNAAAEGSDPLTVKFGLDIMRMYKVGALGRFRPVSTTPSLI